MKTRKQMSQEEATRNPIFLLQRSVRGDHYETESVWYSREEAEQYLKDHEYNYRSRKPGMPGGRVYCVPCRWPLSEILDQWDASKQIVVLDALPPEHTRYSDPEPVPLEQTYTGRTAHS